MRALRISIVGRAGEQTKSEEPVDAELADAVARALGAQLARRGHRLMVYDADSIEGPVVAGYVDANPRADHAILVRQSHLHPSLFPEEKDHPRLFQRITDMTDHWEVSFYRSLFESDGVVLIGGGSPTFIAGQVAIGARIPLLALEKTGGSARVVWGTISPGVDLPTADEHVWMGQTLSDEAVVKWVDALEAQDRRRHAVESRPIRWHAVCAAGLFLASLLFALGSHLFFPYLEPSQSLGLLVASMALGGSAGAAIRMVFERRYGSGPLVTPSLEVTLALGMLAGALAGLLYMVAQPGDIDLETPGAIRLVSIIAVVSVVAGLTAESVFRKLLGIDVVHSSNLAALQGTSGSGPERPES